MAAAAFSGLARVLGQLGGAAAGSGRLTQVVQGLQGLGLAEGGVRTATGALSSAFGGLEKVAAFAINPVNALVVGLSKTAEAAASFALAVSPVTALNTAMESFVGIAQAAIGHVSAIGAAVAPLVAKANPAHIVLFQKAVEDAQASIGMALVPALQFSTALTRGLADIFFRLSGPLSRLMSSFFDPLTRAIPELVDKSEPLISLIGGMISEFATFAGKFSEFLVRAARDLTKLIEAVLGPSRGGVAGRSVGASVTPATFSSVEEFWKKGALNAFNLGTAARGPAEETASNTKRIAEILDGIKTVADAIYVAVNPIEAGKRLVGGGVSAEFVWDRGREYGAAVESGLRSMGRDADADRVKSWIDRFRPSTG